MPHPTGMGQKNCRETELQSVRLNKSFAGGQGLQRAFLGEYMVPTNIKKHAEKIQEIQGRNSGCQWWGRRKKIRPRSGQTAGASCNQAW